MADEPTDSVSSAYPDVVRVRMTVDLAGPLGDELARTAAREGKTPSEVVKDGLSYVYNVLKAKKAVKH